MTFIKKLCLSAFLATAVAACVSTQEMNAKAYAGYAQMKQQNARAIDTTSSTARRIHTVFNRMKPYAEKANTTGVPFQWEITPVVLAFTQA